MSSEESEAKCQCVKAGYCERRACFISEVHWLKCQSGGTVQLDRLYSQAQNAGVSNPPSVSNCVSRIGDELASIIKRETGEAMPCSSCKQEVARLNQLTSDEVNSQKDEIAQGILIRGRKLLGWWQPKRWAIDLAPAIVLQQIEHWIDEAIANDSSSSTTDTGSTEAEFVTQPLVPSESAKIRTNAGPLRELSSENFQLARGTIAGVKRSEVLKRRKEWQLQGFRLPQLEFLRARSNGTLSLKSKARIGRPSGHWSESFRHTCVHFGKYHDAVGCSCSGTTTTRVYHCNHPSNTPYCCLTESDVNRVRCSMELIAVTACDTCSFRQTVPRYVSSAQYVEDIKQLMSIIPSDVTTIAGVSRSGLYTATMLSMLLHLPLDIIRQGQGDIVSGGNGWRLTQGAPSATGRVLVVDDTCMTGNSHSAIRSIAIKHYAPHPVVFGAVYVNPLASSKPDLWAVDLPWPHILEWNLFNSVLLPSCALDFDGILCRDCPVGHDDDGLKYSEFLSNAIPLFPVRRQSIPMVVTARLTKYRDQTQAWLAKWGIKVDELIMGPWENLEQRKQADIAAFKSEHYRNFMKKTIRPPGPHLFIESDPHQAERIAQLSKGIVVCPAANRCF